MAGSPRCTGWRAPRNKVVVAIANKWVRIAWAVLSSGKGYRHQPLQPVEETLRLGGLQERGASGFSSVEGRDLSFQS